MRNKILIIAFVCAAILSVSKASAWSSAGHCTIAHIADQNLTPKARKMCNKYLGHSLAYYASWLDQWRYSHEYHHTARWHAVGIKDGQLVPGQVAGDIADFLAPLTMDDHGIARLRQMQAQLKNYRRLSDSTVTVNLKCIIHMVGDMHCPGHVFFAEQKQYEMVVYGEPLRYHGYNDKAFDRFHKGKSAAQFRDKYCRLTKAEIKALCEGDMESWIYGNESMLRETYKLLSPTIDYKDLPEQNKFRLKEITDQLHRDAGYRLAHVINQIFK